MSDMAVSVARECMMIVLNANGKLSGGKLKGSEYFCCNILLFLTCRPTSRRKCCCAGKFGGLEE